MTTMRRGRARRICTEAPAGSFARTADLTAPASSGPRQAVRMKNLCVSASTNSWFEVTLAPAPNRTPVMAWTRPGRSLQSTRRTCSVVALVSSTLGEFARGHLRVKPARRASGSSGVTSRSPGRRSGAGQPVAPDPAQAARSYLQSPPGRRILRRCFVAPRKKVPVTHPFNLKLAVLLGVGACLAVRPAAGEATGGELVTVVSSKVEGNYSRARLPDGSLPT